MNIVNASLKGDSKGLPSQLKPFHKHCDGSDLNSLLALLTRTGVT